MTWLAWRQFRTQAAVAAVILIVFALVYIVSGVHMANLYRASGISGCHARLDCSQLVSTFLNRLSAGKVYRQLYSTGAGVVLVAPAIIGVFWGAPLITREVEARTFGLAWNQSITGARWLATKLAVVGLSAMVLAGLLSLVLTWWAGPLHAAGALTTNGGGGALSLNRLEPLSFSTTGIAPIGYAAFGFALGVTVGALVRRTVPAMATTLAAFALVQLAWPLWIRPHLFTPKTVSAPVNVHNAGIAISSSGPNSTTGTMRVMGTWSRPGAWVTSDRTVDRAGRSVFPAPRQCLGNGPFSTCTAHLNRLHLRQIVSYQPASRYWPLQLAETAIFVLLAIALAAACYQLIRQRRIA